MARLIYVLNGPNLNLLGEREPDIYGTVGLAEIEGTMREAAVPLDLEIDFRQTNSEGELIDWVQEARSAARGIIINAAGLTHTSVGLLDALKACSLPIVEVHLSNPMAREAFRHRSFVSLAASGVIAGFGARGYGLALEAIHDLLAP